MTGGRATVRVAESLLFFVPARRRRASIAVDIDGSATWVHVIESVGIPRTEVGELRVNGQSADRRSRANAGDLLEVSAVSRPQRLDAARFAVDVHCGTLARRLRLLGIDTEYPKTADAELVARAAVEDRVVLTQDRGLLRRRELRRGAYVRGSDPADQLNDVLGRFDPPLAPWTRCVACNGLLDPVELAQVEHLLEAGTRRSYHHFVQCGQCGRPYWRGAHSPHLSAIVAAARGRYC